MGFGEAVSSCFSKYAVFSGRAPRSELWWWFLFVILVSFGVGIISGILDVVLGLKAFSGIVSLLLDLFFLLPNLAVTMRRLHDLNRSGWWYGGLIVLSLFIMALGIPLMIRMAENHEQGYAPTDGLNPAVFILLAVLGFAETVYSIVLLVWFCMRGTRGPNRFGPDPLQAF